MLLYKEQSTFSHVLKLRARKNVYPQQSSQSWNPRHLHYLVLTSSLSLALQVSVAPAFATPSSTLRGRAWRGEGKEVQENEKAALPERSILSSMNS